MQSAYENPNKVLNSLGNNKVRDNINIEQPKDEIEKSHDIPGGDSNVGDKPVNPSNTTPTADEGIKEEDINTENSIGDET